MRETTRIHKSSVPGGTYVADLSPVTAVTETMYCGRTIWWYSRDVCPSIHMPKFAARIWLEVVSVRAERLQDISYEDVKAEGILFPFSKQTLWLEAFGQLWDSLNAKRGHLWSANDWVWAVEFSVV